MNAVINDFKANEEKLHLYYQMIEIVRKAIFEYFQ